MKKIDTFVDKVLDVLVRVSELFPNLPLWLAIAALIKSFLD